MTKYDPKTHHRRSIRLQGYDYHQAGAYFVTVCTQNGECLFGSIVAGEMQLTEGGLSIRRWYTELSNKFPDIECDAFICMPNHVHFLIINVGADLRVLPDLRVRPDAASGASKGEHIGLNKGEHIGSPLQRVVQWFKTMTTNAYIRGVKQNGWPPFSGKLWQRNYWEHVLRNETELNHIREYIYNNPVQWESDKLFVQADRRVRPDAVPGASKGEHVGSNKGEHVGSPLQIMCDCREDNT